MSRQTFSNTLSGHRLGRRDLVFVPLTVVLDPGSGDGQGRDHVYPEIWGRTTGREVDLSSKKISSEPDSTSWITYKTVKENGEAVSRSQVHKAAYEPLKGEDGDPMPNPAAPADW